MRIVRVRQFLTSVIRMASNHYSSAEARFSPSPRFFGERGPGGEGLRDYGESFK